MARKNKNQPLGDNKNKLEPQKLDWDAALPILEKKEARAHLIADRIFKLITWSTALGLLIHIVTQRASSLNDSDIRVVYLVIVVSSIAVLVNVWRASQLTSAYMLKAIFGSTPPPMPQLALMFRLSGAVFTTGHFWFAVMIVWTATQIIPDFVK